MFAVGPHTTIVEILRKSGVSSIQFLAYKMGIPLSELMTYLSRLQVDGAVIVENDLVWLRKE